MSPTDKVSVSPLSDSDIPTSFAVLSASFAHDSPFIDVYFPAHDTPSGQAQGSARLAKWKQSAPNSTFLKATTVAQAPDQEQLVGLAIWGHMTEPPPLELDKVEPNAKEVWPDAEEREFMTRMWGELVVPRSQVITDAGAKGVYVLEMLAVHPGYQGLGAGKALIRWGLEAADRQGLAAVVEATPVGRPVYEKCGMVPEIEEMKFDLGEKFSGRKTPKLTFLKKEPQP